MRRINVSHYPGVYARRRVLWIKYYDAGGTMVRESTGLALGHEKQAAKIRGDIIKTIARAKQIVANGGQLPEGPLTLARYAGQWIKSRKERGVSSASGDETRFKLHVNPKLVEGQLFGEFTLEDIRPRHI